MTEDRELSVIGHLENCRQDDGKPYRCTYTRALGLPWGWGRFGRLASGSNPEEPIWVIKLPRATGGCLGAESRRRAWRTTIRPGSREQALIRGFPNGATPRPSWA